VKTVFVAVAMTAALLSAAGPSSAQQPVTIENYFASSEPRPVVPSARTPQAGQPPARSVSRGFQSPLGDPANLMSHQYGYAGYPAYGIAPAGTGPGAGEIQYGYIVEPAQPPAAPQPTFAAAGFEEAMKNDQFASSATAKSANPNGGGSCGAGGCGTSMCGNDCCEPFWTHRSGFFAEWLMLRARGADVAYAVPRNGVDPATAVAFGGVATASPNYDPSGFRLGGTYALDRCSSLRFAYTYFQTETDGSVFANPPLSVHSLVTAPQTFTAGSDSLAALSRYRIGFQFVDLDYRRLIAGGRNWALNYAVGTRYAHLSQNFRESQPIGPGATGVATNVNFDGGGSRVGLLGERKAANRGFLFYGKAFADILVGNFRSSYNQSNNFQQTQVWSSWKDFRPVPILEYELGAGWQNASGRVRISGGYYFACWFNTVSTSNYIQAVQTNNYVNVGNAITFDGIVGRVQYVW
jgi:hypothetical protein